MSDLPDFAAVRDAAARIGGVAHRTAVFTSRTLDAICGASVFLKAENLQRSGAFKFRGAYNALSRLSDDARRRGVLTFSSGNHAGAMALAGRELDIPVTVVMPQTAPRAKLEATRGYGAEVILYDPQQTDREQLAAELRDQRGFTLIPPYDHPHIIAGQGTCAMELLQDVGPLDALLVPCGGGGLLSGCALAARALAPSCRVIGVEPETADDAARSFRSGQLQRVHNPPTIADGLRTPSLGQLTFPIIRANVDEFVTVTEAQIIDSMRFLWTRMKLVVEPSGAVAAAPLIARQFPASRGQRIGVILSGGNADLPAVMQLLTQTHI